MKTPPYFQPERPLTDDEIVDQACFPILEQGRRDECFAFAMVVDYASRHGANRVSLVTWSTGPVAIVTIGAGDKSSSARAALIATYRAAERGCLGPLVLGDPHE